MKKVFVCFHPYDRKLAVETVLSLIYSLDEAKKVCDRIDFCEISGCCYIADVRNTLATVFLQSDSDELIFIDSDLGWDEMALAKIIKADRGVIGGAYPYKIPNIKGFPVKYKKDEAGNIIKDEITGYIEAEYIPGGFMKVQRWVFEKLQSLHPEWETSKAINKTGIVYNFFQTGLVFKNDKTWYGEDVAFCKFCTDAGIKIWIEPDITFIHGKITGNYLEQVLEAA